MKLLRKANSIFDRTIDFLAYVAGFCVIFIMLSVAAEVFSRKLLGQSLSWVIGFSEFSLLYMTLLGTTWLLKKGVHPSLDVVVNGLGPRTAALVNVATSIVGAMLCLVLAFFSAVMTWDLFQRGSYIISGTLEIPKAPLIIVIPIGSFLLFIQFLRRAHGYLETWRASPSKEQAA